MFKDFCWIKCFRMDRLYCLFYSMIGIHYRNYVMMNSPTFLEHFYGRELVRSNFKNHLYWHFSSPRIVWWSASSQQFYWWGLWSIRPGQLWSGTGLSGAVWISRHKLWWRRDILLLLPSLSLRCGLLNLKMFTYIYIYRCFYVRFYLDFIFSTPWPSSWGIMTIRSCCIMPAWTLTHFMKPPS